MIDKELTNIEVIHLIQELKRLKQVEASKEERREAFNRIPEEFKITICLGCGENYKGCDCPAGSVERLRSSSGISEILQQREEKR